MTASREALSEIAARLRRAVERGSLGQARALLTDYAAKVEEAVRERVAGEGLEGEALELLEWARRMALASRAAARKRLERLPRPLRAYRPPPALPRHRFELRA